MYKLALDLGKNLVGGAAKKAGYADANATTFA